MTWHIYSGQHCSKGFLGMDLLSSGNDAIMMGQVNCEFEEISQPSFFNQQLLTWFGTFTVGRVEGMDLPSPGMLHSPGDLQGTFPRPSSTSLKTASGWHHPPLSSNAWSKCAKSCQELPTEKWRLVNLLETHRGPAPWWGQHPLKTAGPYLKPTWSSTGQNKCAISRQEPPAEKWSLANLLKTHRGPTRW